MNSNQSLYNQRTRDLQASMSSNLLPCLPGAHSKFQPRSNYHKHQRFKVFGQKGRVEEELRVEGQTHITKNISCDKLQSSKQRILNEWNNLKEREKLLLQERHNVKSNQQSFNKNSSAGSLRVEPSWLGYDKIILRFYLYFVENVAPPSTETKRVRICSLLYYLEDGKTEIDEPKEENSGLAQGTFLKKSVLRKLDGTPYSPSDFMIGTEHKILGRNFRCYSCDYFTRQFLVERGIIMDNDEIVPEDDFHRRIRETTELKVQALHNSRVTKAEQKRPDNLKQYLDNEGKVLRFYGLWDDTGRMFGERNQYILHYFLSDDTIEIRNLNKGENGREPFPLLFKRQRLLKDMKMVQKGYYTAKDLLCGQYIDVLTRKILMQSCDKFTKKYYETELGIRQPVVDFSSMDKERDSLQKPARRTAPPYNGFGSETDSLANCMHLIPKPAKQDLKRFLKNSGKVLKFVAKFTKAKLEDVDRRFAISYFMDDDSCAVYENFVKKCGITGGKFLERGKYKMPLKKIRRVQAVSVETKRLQKHVQDKINSKMIGGPFGLLRAFRQFAINENCMIDLQGFRIGLRSVGILTETATDESLSALFSLYDKTGDGQIDFQEFVDNVMGDRVSPPNDSEYSSRAMKPSDFFVGARVRFLFPQTGAVSQEFSIIRTTNLTLEIMEDPANAEEFPKSNVNIILQNISVALKNNHLNLDDSFNTLDNSSRGHVRYEDFEKVLHDLATMIMKNSNEVVLSEHEVLTLCRKYANQANGQINYIQFTEALKLHINLVLAADQKQREHEKSNKQVLDRISSKIIEQCHSIFDRSTLLHKFQGYCKSHARGVPMELLMFFLRDEFGVDIPSELELDVMLRFDTNCDGLVNREEFSNAFYKNDETGFGFIEKTCKEFMTLNERQKTYNTERMLEYRTVIKASKFSSAENEVTLLKIMKRFTAAFYKKKKQLMKKFLTYDIHRKGVIKPEEFDRVLIATNGDFGQKDRETLLNYVTREVSDIPYEKILETCFRQNTEACEQSFGAFEA